MKKIYGIGTGPGDPELLTLKSVRIIKGASIVFAPNNKGNNMALDTAREFIQGKKVVLLDFPMGNVSKEDYSKGVKRIYDEIPEGGYGVFLTIGDPMIYSTFIYMMDEIAGMGVELEVLPGIPSFVAAASISKTPLTIKGDSFLLCDEPDEEILKSVESIAVLKTLKDNEILLNKLEKHNFDYKYIKRASLDNEEILTNKKDILKEKNYISLILARKKYMGEENEN